jgi:hypothetical protein
MLALPEASPLPELRSVMFPDQERTILSTRTIYWRNLKYWSVHALVCSSISFFSALYLAGYTQPFAIAAMVFAVVTFVCIYAAVSTWLDVNNFNRKSLLRTVIHRASVVRSVFALTSILCVLVSYITNFSLLGEIGSFLGILDVLCGMIAYGLVAALYQLCGVFEYGFGENVMSRGPAIAKNFLSVYLVVMTEGVLISMTLLLLMFPVTLISCITRAYANAKKGG